MFVTKNLDLWVAIIADRRRVVNCPRTTSVSIRIDCFVNVDVSHTSILPSGAD